ncbi:MAG: bifunctional folylpolyglutamate synthase/dihydrofolate synthase [Proteobacteria bacterium]|nr:bifunctional folylpolyglutamate synthase/dihydrofolate synthase [Pseudomonadota bacterium]
MPNTQIILERLTRLHPKLIDLSLDRVCRLLTALGNPHLDLPPVVHVAGTNAKGSVIAIMRAALEASGKIVHIHTSPHLVRFNERIRLAGKLIDDDALIGLLEECEAANEDAPITFFEITTVAALLAFSRTPADVVLLECGLGGRLDATNVVAAPALTVITPVSLDHQQLLGETLAEIAGEKAGILKTGVACVLAAQQPDAETVILARANDIGAEVMMEGRDWSVATGDDGFRIDNRGFPLPSLKGPHQPFNAGLAVAALDRLGGQVVGLKISDADIAGGLGAIDWPARLQHLKTGSLANRLRPQQELWLDGGHNEAAAVAIAGWLAAEAKSPLHLVMGMLNSKNPAAFLERLNPHVTSLRTVAIPGEEASLGADELAAVAIGLGISASPSDSVSQALDEIAQTEDGPGRVLIAGSLYLAGKVLAENG